MKRPKIQYSEQELAQAFDHLSHDQLNRLSGVFWDMRETALVRLHSDDVIANERVSIGYAVESRVFTDLISRVAEALRRKQQADADAARKAAEQVAQQQPG